MSERDITLTLTHDEALVIFECLAKGNTDEAGSIDIGPAEYRAFCALEAGLEKTLTVTFDKDYVRLVEQAKRRLVNTD